MIKVLRVLSTQCYRSTNERGEERKGEMEGGRENTPG